MADALAGLQADLNTKNCWSIAKNAGHADPWRLQHLFNDAVRDEDAIRDTAAEVAWGQVADAPERVLIFDETGDLKKGEHTVGVQRQYTGTAGRIENATVTVFAAWATPERRFLVDYELYLPQSWTADPERMRSAGAPAEVGFATKLVQAERILARHIESGQDPTALVDSLGRCRLPGGSGFTPGAILLLTRPAPKASGACWSAGTAAKTSTPTT